MAASNKRAKLTQAEQRAAAMRAAQVAEYPEKSPEAVALRAAEQLALPRTAVGIQIALERAGLTHDLIASRLVDIVSDGEDGDALKAIDVVMKIEGGYAPTRTANLHGIVAGSSPDRLFSRERFATPPAIVTVTPAEAHKKVKR